MAIELEQRRFLRADSPTHGAAAVVALGQSVSVYPNEQAFADSRGSLVDPNRGSTAEAPAHYVEAGWHWPPRWGSQSFMSHGVFGAADNAEAIAWMAGVVLVSDERVALETGQTFYVARVRTVGFEADVCLAASDHAAMPELGEIIAGTVFLGGSMESLEPSLKRSKRRWFRRH